MCWRERWCHPDDGVGVEGSLCLRYMGLMETREDEQLLFETKSFGRMLAASLCLVPQGLCLFAKLVCLSGEIFRFETSLI